MLHFFSISNLIFRWPFIFLVAELKQIHIDVQGKRLSFLRNLRALKHIFGMFDSEDTVISRLFCDSVEKEITQASNLLLRYFR